SLVQQRKNQSCQSKNKSCLISSALDKKHSELLTYEQTSKRLNKGNQLDLSRGSPKYLGLLNCSRYNSESYRLYQPRIPFYLLFYHLPNRKPLS
ncbi:hypothetical protein, partial [Leuconostoc citreum]|uniref:hypothetical protein n=1 Tax=Leuconostoc citreum TaxID=33964 RepID=UPI0032DFBD55